MIEENDIAWWDSDLSIVRGRPVGIINEAMAQTIKEKVMSMGDDHGPEVDWVIDLTGMTTATGRARRILTEATAHRSIQRCSFWGAGVFVRTLTNFIFLAIGRNNCRHFGTEQEAIDWVMGDRDHE